MSRKFFQVRSDSTVHFTTAIIQNAMDLESVGAVGVNAINRLPTQQVVLTRLAIWSTQNLDWDIMFFRTVTGQPGAVDADSMSEWITFAAGDGVQIAGAGAFRYALSNFEIPYSSDENQGQIHIGLINRSAAAKIAGAGGEFVIEVEGYQV